MGGRTTNLEHYNPIKPSRNGLTYFVPCLTSHSPLDMVIIMLGTNDLKLQYNRPIEKISDALGEYLHIVNAELPDAHVLLVGPIHINETVSKFAEYYEDTYDNVSAQKSRDLARVIRDLADKTGTLFFDASTVAKAGRDGIHFDKQSHGELANSLAAIVRSV